MFIEDLASKHEPVPEYTPPACLMLGTPIQVQIATWPTSFPVSNWRPWKNEEIQCMEVRWVFINGGKPYPCREIFGQRIKETDPDRRTAGKVRIERKNGEGGSKQENPAKNPKTEAQQNWFCWDIQKHSVLTKTLAKLAEILKVVCCVYPSRKTKKQCKKQGEHDMAKLSDLGGKLSGLDLANMWPSYRHIHIYVYLDICAWESVFWPPFPDFVVSNLSIWLSAICARHFRTVKIVVSEGDGCVLCAVPDAQIYGFFWVVGYLCRSEKKGGHGGCCGSHPFRDAFHNFGGFDRCDLKKNQKIRDFWVQQGCIFGCSFPRLERADRKFPSSVFQFL